MTVTTISQPLGVKDPEHVLDGMLQVDQAKP